MRGRAYIGTSGFAYPAWEGAFYPEGIKRADMLASYATRLPSVEINYTFGRFPTDSLLSGWAAKTPPSFAFAFKAPRRITHELRLRDAADPVERFFSVARRLGGRLGPTLFQTPPNLPADVERLETFVGLLPAGARCSFEFRHPSWDAEEIRALLGAGGAAWCTADTDEADAVFHRTTPAFVYLRLRKSEYPPEALDRWAAELGAVLDDGGDVYCYFRHTDDGRGTVFAQELGARLAARP
jgi:uncharacterized protein YecE (DUF72 family)